MFVGHHHHEREGFERTMHHPGAHPDARRGRSTPSARRSTPFPNHCSSFSPFSYIHVSSGALIIYYTTHNESLLFLSLLNGYFIRGIYPRILIDTGWFLI